MSSIALVISDFAAICRLCLHRDRPLTCLFSHGQYEVPLYLMAETCAAVDIDEEDGLPRNICCACRDAILSSYQFREQVGRNDTILRCVAGMKPEPEEEGLSEEADVTVMMDEKFWTAENNARETISGSAMHDSDVKSNYVQTINASPNETEAGFEGTGLHFLVEDGRPSACNNVALEEISSCSKDQWSNDRSTINPDINRVEIKKLINNQKSSSMDNGNNVRTKMREFGTPAADGSGYCSVCRKIFCQFYEHVQLRHLKIGGFCCDQCDVWGKSKESLARHIANVHINKKSYNDRYRKCAGRSLLSTPPKSNLLEPIHNSTVSEEICFKINEYGTLAADGKRYFCRLCERFYPKFSFLNHIKMKHLQIRDFMCDQCGYRSFSKAHLTYHIQKKCPSWDDQDIPDENVQNSAVIDEVRAKIFEYGTRNPDGSYYCKPCNKLYKKNVYFSHVKAFHLRIRNFMCEQCGFRTITKTLLIQHIDGIHLRVKKYKCLTCSMRFFTKSKLNAHARKHRPGGVRKFMCEVCGKPLTTREDLLRHLRAQHFPELKIKCEFCDCRYASRNKLREHLRKVH